jgi:uncharacterized membrane protein YbhN (UPF0104 family)
MAELSRRLRFLGFPTEAEEAGGSPRRRRTLHLLGVAILLAFAIAGLRGTDLGAVRAALAGASAPLLGLACAANFASLAVHAGRWRALVRAPSRRVRFRDALSALTAGLAVGMAVPARAGDLVRAHLLARRVGLSTAAVVGTAALDYVVGGAVLVPLLAVLAIATPLPTWADRAVWTAVGVAAAGGFAAWLLRPPRAAVLAGERGRGMIARLRHGLSVTHEPRALGEAVAWGLAAWTSEAAIAAFALAAFGLPSTPQAAALAVLATTAASAISLSPGNAGPFEVAAALAVMGLGAGRETALAFALGYHLAHLLPTGVAGTLALVREARARRETAGGGGASGIS